YWRLIKRFEELTGVPVVMNTSFNVRGMPVVCSPEDAVKCFFDTGLDHLAIGSFLLSKDGR
ncbi:MAG TPA: carbamoyltransferase C-terminal domain-containing protein, partial [Longimicrobium sp.]